MNRHKIEITRHRSLVPGRGVRFNWRVRHANGQVVAASQGQHYSRRIDAETSARNLVSGVYADAEVVDA